jgi:TRAP-type C4-dicarboxylate transport system permease small subunit
MLAISATIAEYVDRASAPLGNAARTVFDRFDYVFERWFSAMDRLEQALWTISIALMIILVFIIAGQVVTRYVFNWVPPWGGELGRTLAIWMSLLLLPALTWSDRNLQVEFVFEKLSLRMRRRIRTLQLLIITGFGAAFTYYGWAYATTAGFRSVSTSLHRLIEPIFGHGVELDMFYIYVILPLSGVLFVIMCISKLIQINYNPDQLEEDYRERYGAVEIED